MEFSTHWSDAVLSRLTYISKYAFCHKCFSKRHVRAISLRSAFALFQRSMWGMPKATTKQAIHIYINQQDLFGDLSVLDPTVCLYWHNSSVLCQSTDVLCASDTWLTHSTSLSVGRDETHSVTGKYAFIMPAYFYSTFRRLLLLPPLGGVELGSLEPTPKSTSSPTL